MKWADFKFLPIILLIYAALLWPQSKNGLSALDANAVVDHASRYIEKDITPLSRPLGHPTTEMILLPLFSKLLGGDQQTAVNAEIYIQYQIIGGVLCLLSFFVLLRVFDFSQMKSNIAVVTLAASPSFLKNCIDGEEFLWALFFVFLAFISLHGKSNSQLEDSQLHEGLGAKKPFSILPLLFIVLATGCRLEFGLFVLVFPLLAYFQKRPFWHLLVAGLQFSLLFFLLWSPIFWYWGLTSTYPNYLTRIQTLMSLGYKIMFPAYSLPLWLCSVIVLVKNYKAFMKGEDRSYVTVLSLVFVSVIWGMFILLPHKTDYLLAALPFLLILLLREKMVYANLALTGVLFSVFCRIDVVNEGRFSVPKFYQGYFGKLVRRKPVSLAKQMKQLFDGIDIEKTSERRFYVTRFWDKEFAFFEKKYASQILKNEINIGGEKIPYWTLKGKGDQFVFVSRSLASCIGGKYNGEFLRLLKYNVDENRIFFYDRALYRRQYMRYKVNADLEVDKFNINGNPFFLYTFSNAHNDLD